jgi:hypothetical protein
MDYYQMGLHALEQFAEGRFILAGRIAFERYYDRETNARDRHEYQHLIKIKDITR